MSKKNILFQKSKIKNLEEFLTADSKSFNYIIDTLVKRKYLISQEKVLILKTLPTFDKFLWNPGNHYLNPVGEKELKIFAGDVLHEGMHAIVTQRYGSQLKDKPKLTLLAESIASMSELYFTLTMTNNLGYKKSQKITVLSEFQQSAKALKIPLVRYLNKCMDDPFNSFKKSVKDMIKAYDILINFENSLSKNKPVNLKSLEKSLKKIPYYVFMRHYDFANNVLFVSNFCGSHSNQIDQHQTKDCLTILNKSKSFFEFLQLMNKEKK